MAKPKPDIERTQVNVRFLPDQLARIDAWDGAGGAPWPAGYKLSRQMRLDRLLDLGLEAAERRARRKPAVVIPAEEE